MSIRVENLWFAYGDRPILRGASDMDAIIACADTVLVYEARGFLLERFEKSSMSIMKKSMRLHRRRAMGNALVPLVGIGGHFALLIAGNSRIPAGALAFGTLLAVLQFRGGLLKSMTMLMNCVINMKTAMAGVKRVTGTLDIAPADQASQGLMSGDSIPESITPEDQAHVVRA